MSRFIVKQSVILSDYESHRSLSFQFYERGVIIKSRQDEVNNKDSGGNPNHFPYLIVSHLNNDEAIDLRDRLLARYPLSDDTNQSSGDEWLRRLDINELDIEQ